MRTTTGGARCSSRRGSRAWRWAEKLLAHMHLGSHPALDEIGEDEAREHGIDAEFDADPSEEL